MGLLKYYNSPFNIPTLPGWDIYIYNYNTNPVKEDTDNDGLLDGRAIVETVDGKEVIVAPKDYNPKDYDGPKNIWKTHIRSVKSGSKFAHSYSDDYFEPVKFEGSIKFYGIIPYLDSNLIEWASSKISSFGSKFCDFRYDDKHIALHSDEWQWQALAGYNKLYDVVFDAVTSMDSYELPFESGDREYIIWLWKGNYINLGPGSEVGFYDDNTWGIGQWYVSDSLDMTCSLYKKVGDGSIYTTLYNWYPDEQQWWITGFVPDIYDYSSVDESELVQVSSVKLGEQKYNDFLKIYKDSEDSDNIIFDEENKCIWIVW